MSPSGAATSSCEPAAPYDHLVLVEIALSDSCHALLLCVVGKAYRVDCSKYSTRTKKGLRHES